MSAAPETAAPEAPEWFGALLRRVPQEIPKQFRRFGVAPPEAVTRDAAVLMLLGEGEAGPDVLLTERASTLRSHASQVSFPGGRLDPEDGGVPARAAMREAVEETGLDPAGVRIGASLPSLYLSASGHQVTPVVAWWAAPSPVSVMDPAEVARVVRVPVAELADPANRGIVTGPSGYKSPVFLVRGLTVWGFTAGLLGWLLALGDWDQAWEPRELDVDLPGLPRRGAPPLFEGGAP